MLAKQQQKQKCCVS